VFVLVIAGRAWTAWSYHRVAPSDDAASVVWLRAWNIGTLASGALWGAAAWLFYGHGEPLHQLAMVLVIYAFGVGSTPLLGWQRTIFFAYIGLTLVPTIARVWQVGGPGSLGLVVVSVLILAMTVRLGRNYAISFGELVELSAARAWPGNCAPKPRSPRRRAARPRPPTGQRRSSSPPPATICASRCMRSACSPRRCAKRAATTRRCN
jgi:hypothetical protein